MPSGSEMLGCTNPDTDGDCTVPENLTGTSRVGNWHGDREEEPARASCRSALRRRRSRPSIIAVPHSQTPATASATPGRCDRPTPMASSPLSCVAHAKVDAPKRSKNPPSGTMKLQDVTTQIQYFQVALVPRIEVMAHAARQRIEAYRRCTSR